MFNQRVSMMIAALATLAFGHRAFAEEVSCLSIQQGGGGEVADTFIASHQPAAVNGAGPYLVLGGDAVARAEALLRFDLADVPSGTHLYSATVTLEQQASSGPSALEVRRVTAPWEQELATWMSCAGAFDPAVEATSAIQGAAYSGPVSFDVTELAQLWVNGIIPNDGVRLSQTPGGRTRFGSSEDANVASRPRLELCFVAHPQEAGPDGESFTDEDFNDGEAGGDFNDGEDEAAQRASAASMSAASFASSGSTDEG